MTNDPARDYWSHEEERELARMWCVEDMSTRDIGYEMDRSKSSVYRTIKRLELNGHKGNVRAFEKLFHETPVSMPFRPVRLNLEPPREISGDMVDTVSLHWSDVHFPFQDDRCLDILYQVASEVKPDIVVDHGDLMDFWQISDHRAPEERKLTHWQVDLQETINRSVEHLGIVSDAAGASQRIYKRGNHEDRWERLMSNLQKDYKIRHIMALDNIKEVLQLENIMGLDEIGYETSPYTGGDTITLFDRLVIAHGHRTNKWAARSMLDSYGKSVMFGHTHRYQVFASRSLKGAEAGFNLPCMCSLNVEYMPVTNWQQGFSVVEWHKDPDLGWLFNVNTVLVHDGVAVFRGKAYT